MPPLLRRGRLLAVLTLLLTWTGTGRADPVTVTGSATLQGDGSYLYQYTMTNSVPSPVVMAPEFNLQLITGGFAPATNMSQTEGWTFNPTWSSASSYLWIHNGPLPANSTATFAFNSTEPPGDAFYTVSGFPPQVWWTGHIVGPAPAAPPIDVPEPASVVLLATAGGVLLRRLLRKPVATATD